MHYNEQQIKTWKAKAEQWDKLGEEIAECYVTEDEDGEYVENDDDDCDLMTIGEIAARAFGWL